MNRKIIIRSGIILFWLCTMLCLARYEAFPERFTHTLRGYRSILDASVLMQESWSRILIGDTPAGYSHTNMNVDDEGDQPNIEIHNRTHIKATLLGQPFAFHAQTTLLLDTNYELLSFESSLSAQGISFRITGQRLEARQFKISSTVGNTTTHQQIEIPKDAMLYSPMSALALRKLSPGQELTIKTLDPLSMNTARIRVRAVRRETIQLAGETKPATLLVSNFQGMQLNSWVDKNGTLLRQETPLGWIIESCTSEAALDTVANNHPPPDLMTHGSGAALMQLLLSGRKEPTT